MLHERLSPFSITLFALALSIVGWGMLPRLAFRWSPPVSNEKLSVHFSWPSAPPELVEAKVTRVLESSLALVPGIDGMRSVSQEGGGYVSLTLDRSADPSKAKLLAVSRIRQVYPSLPPRVSFPRLSAGGSAGPSASPLLVYRLSGPTDYEALSAFAHQRLRPQLALMPGLDHTSIAGDVKTTWRITLRPGASEPLGMDARTLRHQLRESLARGKLGSLREEHETHLLIQTAGSDEAPHGVFLENLVIGRRGDRLLRVKDVAEVEYVTLPVQQHFRINGENSIRLLCFAEEEANDLELAARVRRRMEALSGRLPPAYTLRLERDRSIQLLRESRNTARRSLLSVAILLLFVLLSYRSWRYLAVISFSLLVCAGISALFYALLGVAFNLYALTGLIVSFGILLDNIILMAHHRQSPHHNPPGPALAGANLTTVAALGVIFLLPEVWRLVLQDMAWVMIINLGVSLLVAVLLVPALTRQWLPVATASGTDAVRSSRWLGFHVRLLQWMIGRRAWWIIGVILLFGLPIFRLPATIEGAEWYNRTLGGPWYAQHLRQPLNVLLGGTFRLFSSYVFESGGYREPTAPKILVTGTLPQGMPLSSLNDAFLRMEDLLSRHMSCVDQFMTSIQPDHRGTIEVTFDQGCAPGYPLLLQEELSRFANTLGGIEWQVSGLGDLFNNGSSNEPSHFRVQLRGYDREVLRHYADELASRLGEHPKVKEISTAGSVNWWDASEVEYVLHLDRQRIAALHQDPTSVRYQLAALGDGQGATFWLPNGQPVRITSRPEETIGRWELTNGYSPGDSIPLPLNAVASLEQTNRAPAIHKVDQSYLQVVEFDYIGHTVYGLQLAERVLTAFKYTLPLGISAHREAPAWEMAGGFDYIPHLLLVIVVIFWITAILFESIRQAFATLLLIPLSFIGIFVAFYWTGAFFDQGGYLSFLLVGGLGVNNLIFIINEYNGLKRKYPEADPVLLYAQAYHRKTKPILLTIGSTIFGLAPFLLASRHAIFWYPLTVGTTGGLLFSIIVITFISPLFLLARSRRRTAQHSSSR